MVAVTGAALSVLLGLLVALSLVRELGPVVTALLFAGRAGTSLTAEIGLMRAGEQLSAMEMMAVDPVRRILAPRTLVETTRIFQKSTIARDWLGDTFVDHFAATRDWEWRQWLDGVTDWEMKRYFEII